MVYDLLIIGGGINGAAIAREASRNGLKILLVEKDDLANHTSSASTKLIHGGLRYLEHYKFGLVFESLKERTLLMRVAPHLLEPTEFVLPQTQSSRPWLMVRAGLFLYDLLAGLHPLPWARRLMRSDDLFQQPLSKPGPGFVYWDCRVDDARLCILNALDAAQNGAEIRTHTALVGAKREGGQWVAQLSDNTIVVALAIINAAGPWVSEILSTLGCQSKNGTLLVKGSHIVVPSLYQGEHCYFLQQPDGRIVFVAPYHGNTTMIGTTDVQVETPENPQIDETEKSYLCNAANQYFKRTISLPDIVLDWSGIRPLYDDGAKAAQSVTRDYVLELDMAQAPILSVFGGKITTARHLAEVAVKKIGQALGAPTRPTTRTQPLPGGDFGNFQSFFDAVIDRYPFLGAERARRMAKAYGTMIHEILNGRNDLADDFGGGLSKVEVDWLVSREWAKTADDIFSCRTKLGVTAHLKSWEKLSAYLKRNSNDPCN